MKCYLTKNLGFLFVGVRLRRADHDVELQPVRQQLPARRHPPHLLQLADFRLRRVRHLLNPRLHGKVTRAGHRRCKNT